MEQTKRWAQIVYWDRPTLELLHKLERMAHDRQEAQVKRRDRITGCWELIFPQIAAEVAARFQLNPFWPDSMPKEEHERRLMDFKRTIYPIWGKIHSEWTRNQSGTELSMIHNCDDAIFASGHKPERLYLGDINAIRARAAKSQMRSQYQEAMSA